MALSKTHLNLLLHMLEQLDGLELRLTVSASPTTTLLASHGTFTRGHTGAADDLEKAIDLLHTASAARHTACKTTIGRNEAHQLALEARDQRRVAKEALEVFKHARIDLMKMRSGLGCLKLDVRDIGGFELGELVGGKNERARQRQQQHYDQHAVHQVLRRASSAPLLGCPAAKQLTNTRERVLG
ncbi:hypothetical protein BAUCODRAFT_151720 [Baudoinia panamericana UAMH 10762]|uniref:Uncharacterized protein n=1 Tax=Baudoinia panamericana (strain UAMH 10762) TaxID=717646 RepID=M2MLN9_BAUPA|nr:uncharacterized protein BAUCODRAFT_151720 [Baudoinia panamericana UAMH 10762]EMC92308.1 hypothetical protein BAUCODRAFT_151720 [Baudoinia panamericana UAMH 10762]